MSINNVILFVSTTSHSSIGPIKFIREHSLPVLIVRLDTIEDRVKAANGPIFKITEVPSLVVFYTDNTLQMYGGSDKIMIWLNAIIQSKQAPVEQPDTIVLEEEEPIPKKKSSKKKSSKKKKKVSFETIDLLDDGEPTQPPPKNISITPPVTNKSRNSDIMAMAKLMEKERDSTLNLKEADRRY